MGLLAVMRHVFLTQCFAFFTTCADALNYSMHFVMSAFFGNKMSNMQCRKVCKLRSSTNSVFEGDCRQDSLWES